MLWRPVYRALDSLTVIRGPGWEVVAKSLGRWRFVMGNYCGFGDTVELRAWLLVLFGSCDYLWSCLCFEMHMFTMCAWDWWESGLLEMWCGI